MNAEEICKFLLERCREEGATDVVVSVSESEEGMIRFSNNEITVADTLIETVGNVFVKVESKKASTTIADLSTSSLKTATRKVVAAARNSPPADIYAPLPLGPFNYNPRLLRQEPVPVDARTLVGWTKDTIDAGLKEGAERMAGSLTARNVDYTLMTSGGVHASAENSSLELSVRAFGENLASGHSVSIASAVDEFKPDEAGAEAGRYAKLAANPVQGSPGEYDTLLGPMVFADIANQVGRMSSAFFVDAGLSFLSGKLGEKLASEKFSLSDDASLENTYGASPFDGEGLPTKPTAIFEHGVLKNYLHNSTTAKKFGTHSTANAGLVAPHPFNLVVKEGDKTLDQLIGKVDNGLFVTNDWYLRYQNYNTGDFSTIPRDAMFVIKNGEMGGSIKELRISENMLRVLQNVEAMGQERRWIRWWEVEVPTLSPSVLVNNMKFTRSSM